jgi:hypothetical protein
MENDQEKMTSRIRSLRSAASLLEVVAILSSIGGVIAGIVIATHTQKTTPAGALTTNNLHPWVAAGIAVVIAAILLGVLSWCVARAIGLVAADVAARRHVDISERAPSRLPPFLQR